MEDRVNAILFFGGIAVMAVIFCYSLVTAVVTTTTPEYGAGYSLGYSEHNETKYQAAGILLRDYLHYTKQQRSYARGYYNGYEAYDYDVLVNTEAKERNETIKALGV